MVRPRTILCTSDPNGVLLSRAAAHLRSPIMVNARSRRYLYTLRIGDLVVLPNRPSEPPPHQSSRPIKLSENITPTQYIGCLPGEDGINLSISISSVLRNTIHKDRFFQAFLYLGIVFLHRLRFDFDG